MMENKEYRSRQPGRRPMGHGPGSGGEKANDLIGTWKKLFDYCNQYKVVIVIALICAMVGTVFTLVGPNKLSDMTQQRKLLHGTY